MKLMRYGELGQEKPGIIDDKGNIRDISSYIKDLDSVNLGDETLVNYLKQLDISQLTLVENKVRIGACVAQPGKIICIGLNSTLHAKEVGLAPLTSSDMVVFLKPICAVCGPTDPILYTRHMKKLDWEAELGVVIGKKGKYITKEFANDHILGYTCINDLSERHLQLETQDKQYTKGKGFDNAAPIGPYLVTKDEVANASDLQIKLWVNNELRQNFNTSDYIHSPQEVVSYLSQYFTLYPGDVISMGSAPGSAQSWGDHAYLKPNDKVTLNISGLGQQEQLVIVE